jgi:starvation-inducible DNA-binding protein
MLQPVSYNIKAGHPPISRPQNVTVEALQKQIANAFYLYLNYKHYHWETDEPVFKDLHIIFDEFANDVHDVVEELAERVRATGENRVRAREFSNTATVKPAREKSNALRMIEEAAANALKVIKETREAVEKIAVLDPRSANALRNFLVINEKHEWWLRHILKKSRAMNPAI